MGSEVAPYPSKPGSPELGFFAFRPSLSCEQERQVMRQAVVVRPAEARPRDGVICANGRAVSIECLVPVSHPITRVLGKRTSIVVSILRCGMLRL